jgi:hypothetical protein
VMLCKCFERRFDGRFTRRDSGVASILQPHWLMRLQP